MAQFIELARYIRQRTAPGQPFLRIAGRSLGPLQSLFFTHQSGRRPRHAEIRALFPAVDLLPAFAAAFGLQGGSGADADQFPLPFGQRKQDSQRKAVRAGAVATDQPSA